VAAQVDALEARDRRIVQSQGPSQSFAYAPNGPQIQFSSRRADGEATLSLAAEVSRTNRAYDPVSGDDRRASWTSRLYLRGVAPIGEGNENAPIFVNLAEPLDGARITLGFVHYISRYTLHRGAILDALHDRTTLVGDCLRHMVDQWRRQPGRSAEQMELGRDYVAAYEAQLSTERRPELALLITNRGGRFSDIPDEVKNHCLTGQEGSAGDEIALASEFNATALSESMLRAFTGDAPTLFYGAEATVSQKDYSFLNRTAFSIDDVSHRGYSLSAFAGWIGGTGRWSLRGGLSYTRTYDEQHKVNLCRPVAGTTDTQCLTGADGAPTRNSETAFSLEARALIATPVGDVGIAPVVGIGLNDGEYTVNVPIYVARNDDHQLTGGIQFGYSSEKSNFMFGFFVGVPLNIAFH
jgi:hypothetical protein